MLGPADQHNDASSIPSPYGFAAGWEGPALADGPWRAPRYEGSFQPFPYVVLDRTPMGRYVIERAELETPHGPSPYSVVHCSCCACVLAVVGHRVLLVRQYRYAVRSWQDELVAGGVEAGESPREAALRELREETGFQVLDGAASGTTAESGAQGTERERIRQPEQPATASDCPEARPQIVDLGAFFPSAGSSDEVMYLFAVRIPEEVRPGATDFDRGEQTERLLLSRSEVERRMAEGSLTHSAFYVAWERLRLCGLLDEWLPERG